MTMETLANLIAEGNAPEDSKAFAGEYSQKALAHEKKDD